MLSSVNERNSSASETGEKSDCRALKWNKPRKRPNINSLDKKERNEITEQQLVEDGVRFSKTKRFPVDEFARSRYELANESDYLQFRYIPLHMLLIVLLFLLLRIRDSELLHRFQPCCRLRALCFP